MDEEDGRNANELSAELERLRAAVRQVKLLSERITTDSDEIEQRIKLVRRLLARTLKQGKKK